MGLCSGSGGADDRVPPSGAPTDPVEFFAWVLQASLTELFQWLFEQLMHEQ